MSKGNQVYTLYEVSTSTSGGTAKTNYPNQTRGIAIRFGSNVPAVGGEGLLLRSFTGLAIVGGAISMFVDKQFYQDNNITLIEKLYKLFGYPIDDPTFRRDSGLPPLPYT